MVCTGSAHINQIESVLSRLSESDRLLVAARFVWTVDVVSSLQGRVFNDVFVDLEHLTEVTSLLSRTVIALVDTIVPFVTFSGLFEIAADPAIVDQAGDVLGLVVDLLLWIKHIVTLSAEPHSFELGALGL
mgnify:CR=1 FL=1